jgi:hypothetical protein
MGWARTDRWAERETPGRMINKRILIRERFGLQSIRGMYESKKKFGDYCQVTYIPEMNSSNSLGTLI